MMRRPNPRGDELVRALQWQDVEAMRNFLDAGNNAAARELHNEIVGNDGMRRDEHAEWYSVTAQELKP